MLYTETFERTTFDCILISHASRHPAPLPSLWPSTRCRERRAMLLGNMATDNQSPLL